MRAEEIKHVLAAAAIDFLAGEADSRQVFLYSDDVLADGVAPLSAKRAIRVTFKKVNLPRVPRQFRKAVKAKPR